MSVCLLDCTSDQADAIKSFKAFADMTFHKVDLPLTASELEIEILVVGSNAKEPVNLAATVSDWNIPPVVLFILSQNGYEDLAHLLHHHPRVGRSVFFCRDTPESIETGLGEVALFLGCRDSLKIDNAVSGNFSANNVSPRWLFQLMMDQLDEYIYFKDKDSRFLAASQYLANNCNKDSPSEILGLTDFEFFNKEHADEAFSDERDIATGKISELSKVEKIMRDGKVRWVYSRKLPLHTRSGYLAGSFGLSRDVTEEKLLHQELEENHERMQAELLLARNLQNTLVGGSVPEFKDPLGNDLLQISTKYVPSFHLSGDFFSVKKTPDGNPAFLVADVMGHGVRAAMITSMIQVAVQQLHTLANQPEAFMQGLNAMLNQSIEPTGEAIFATAVYCYLDIETLTLQYIQAGANHGIHVPVDKNTPPQILSKGSTGPALGLLPDTAYSQSSISLKRGDKVVLYTDGLVEAASREQEFGEGRLMDFLSKKREGNLSFVIDELIEHVQDFSRIETFEDDLCFVGISL